MLPQNAIAKAVETELRAGLFPGAVVLTGAPGKVLCHEAFGVAQVEPERVPMRADSIFDVASVTKAVCTATAVGICRDRGLIDPDAPMTRYLPGHTGPGAEKVTLRHLASHTSGYTDAPHMSDNGKCTGAAMFQRMLAEGPAQPVETHYEYACKNSVYLSTIVENVTGRSFEAFCREEIFQPLEMKEVWFNRVEPSPRVVATHHRVTGENHNFAGRDAGRAVGNAGLFTTAAELARFCETMLGRGIWNGRRIISEETLADFTRPFSSQFPKRGFLWETDRQSMHRPARLSPTAYGHGGSTGISLWIDPEQAVYVLVLTNRTHPRVNTPSGKEPSSSPRVIEQYRARARIGDVALKALGY